MFRFDHGVSQQGVGGHRDSSGQPIHRVEPTLNERAAAPAIYWSVNRRMRVRASAWT